MHKRLQKIILDKIQIFARQEYSSFYVACFSIILSIIIFAFLFADFSYPFYVFAAISGIGAVFLLLSLSFAWRAQHSTFYWFFQIYKKTMWLLFTLGILLEFLAVLTVTSPFIDIDTGHRCPTDCCCDYHLSKIENLLSQRMPDTTAINQWYDSLLRAIEHHSDSHTSSVGWPSLLYLLIALSGILLIIVTINVIDKCKRPIYALTASLALSGMTLFAMTLVNVESFSFSPFSTNNTYYSRSSSSDPQFQYLAAVYPFDTGEHNALSDSTATDRLANLITLLHAKMAEDSLLSLTLVGRADKRDLNMPHRLKYGSNLGLGQLRAEFVKNQLLAGKIIDSSRIMIVISGSTTTEANPSNGALAADRRVDVYAAWGKRPETSSNGNPLE